MDTRSEGFERNRPVPSCPAEVCDLLNVSKTVTTIDEDTVSVGHVIGRYGWVHDP
jgi:hypothetical protein